MHYPMNSYEADHHIVLYLELGVNDAIFFYFNLSGNSLCSIFWGGLVIFSEINLKIFLKTKNTKQQNPESTCLQCRSALNLNGTGEAISTF